MAPHVGVDWAGKGWFGAARRSDGTWYCDLYPTIWNVWKAHPDAECILVDVPIGLPSIDHGRRRCGERAKHLLGEQHQRVFYAPVRDAVYETNLTAAKKLNEAAGYSIQNQCWSVVPRIREIDEFLDDQPGARDRLRETHPEVCYRSLNGRSLETDPTSEAGRKRRRELLVESEPSLEPAIIAAIDAFTEPRFAPLVGDPRHVLDAFVAAWTAARDPAMRSTLPEAPPTDDRGLPMEIVYPSDAHQLTLTDVPAP